MYVTYIANSAELEVYKECRVKLFKFLATLDLRTSDICAAMDGKIIKLEDAVPGVNVPPLHPWCRSTTIAVIDDAVTDELKRRAKDPETGEYYEVPQDMTYEEWCKNLDKSAKSGIMKVQGDKIMNINNIDSPIEQRNTGKGNSNAIIIFDRPLNNRQKLLLENLKEYDSRVVVKKKDVNMKDLSALTAVTGDEFAMFTKGNERIVIRGNSISVNIDTEKATELNKQGYKWSGHTHPGVGKNSSMPSVGDKAILNCFKQRTSVIYNAKGQYRTFEKE